MKTLLAIVAPTILLAACASGGSTASSAPTYWSGTKGSVTEFRRDNVLCSARASRYGNGAAAPENSMDRPPQKWSNAEAQEAYHSCMLESGWRPAS